MFKLSLPCTGLAKKFFQVHKLLWNNPNAKIKNKLSERSISDTVDEVDV